MHIKSQISLTRKVLYSIMTLGIFLSIFGAGAVPSARAQGSSAVTMAGAIVSISTDQIFFGAAEDVILHVTITNPNDYSIRMLKWLTPVDGVGGPLFGVTRDGEQVAYIGIFAKRAAPTEQDYIVLAAGESLTRDVNLFTNYDLSVSGDYAVKYNVTSADLYAKEDGKQFDNILTSNLLELSIEGRANRVLQEVLPQTVSGANSFVSCDASQQTDIANARNAASTYAANAAAHFSANMLGSRYTTWFGMYDLSRYTAVSSHYTAVQNAIDNANPMTFDCSCPSYSGDPSVFAYVHPDSPYNIYLCGAFWGAPITGTNSKAGTLIHETTHFTVIAGTSDYAYGQSLAQTLAINNPAQAIMNADNHEYFAENNPSLSDGIVVNNTNDSGAGSLRQAIADAPNGDTITFDAALSGGTIHLASTLTLSKDVTIDGSALASKITISGDTDNNGAGDVRVFYVYNGVTATLNNLIITRGSSTYGGGGGGIYTAGTLTVTNSTLSDNSATSYYAAGGGIYNDGVLSVTNSIFSGNSAPSYNGAGGGIFNYGNINNHGGTLTVTNSTFSDNSSSSGGGIGSNGGTLTVTNSTFSGNSAGGGGGINNLGSTLAVTNSTFSGNSAGDGGGIYNDSLDALTITSSTFSGNSANNNGGGIYNGNGCILIVSNSSFSGNSAFTYGGGIYNNYSALTVTNSTLSGNSTTSIYSVGGGIYNGSGSGSMLTITNSTLSGNSASSFGGGIYNGSMLIYANTIIANSTAGGDCNNGSTIVTNTNNLVEDGSCSASLSGDPNLGALASNGGPTQTFALLAGSKAIDAGNDAVCAADPVNSLDQRGMARPFGAHCDIGAYEGGLPPTTLTLNLKSNGVQDGWILESGENTNAGGTLNSVATTFNLGDNVAKKQYRGILSFGTGAILPDTAIITKVTLKIKKSGVMGGGNPVTTFKGFIVDIKKGFFGTVSGLQASDFQAAASKTYGPFISSPASNWYSINLTTGKAYINKLAATGGLTQIRLRFKLDDNNNTIANVLGLYSGNAPTASRPQLIVEYYIP